MPLSPALLFSLPSLLLLLLALLGLSEFAELFEMSPSASIAFVFGARHAGSSQTTPVKVLRRKPDFAHFLHGLPVLSRARSPALIAPWLAFGPSLWVGPGAGPLGLVWMIVPSSFLGFFFGPGRARCFTGSSTPAPSGRLSPVLGLEGSFLTVSSLGDGSVFGSIGAWVSVESDLVSSCDGGSSGAANVDLDKGDFFFGTDFEGPGS